MARSLKTGKPLERRTIQLVTANNRVLDEKKTNENGVAEFPVTLAQGSNGNKLAAIFATGSDDFSFIDFSRDFFDMSNRGVEGRAPAKDLDAFIYTERGIYRPGETIRAALIVRDPQGKMPAQLPPLTILMRAADGSQLGASQTVGDWGEAGGALAQIAIPANAPLGIVRLEARLGSEVHRLGLATVQVADFKPDRARLAFDPAAWSFNVTGAKAAINGSATVQYLYGIGTAEPGLRDALVEGAMGEAEFLLRKGTTPVAGCYADYSFGPGEENFIPAFWRKTLEQPSDSSGRLNVATTLEGFPEAKFPLDMNVSVSAFDQSGTLARKTENVIVPLNKPLIGIRLGKSTSLASGEVEFDLLALDAQSQPRFGDTLQVELMAERDDFIYVNVDDRWKPSPQVGRTQAAEPRSVRTVNAEKEAKPGCFKSNASTKYTLAPGRYFLKVTGAAGVTASKRFTVGYSSADSKEPSPDKADVMLAGNGQYRVGDTLDFNIEAPFNGEIAIAISDGDVIGWYQKQTDGRKRAAIRVPVQQDWAGKALYAIVTVFRPGGDAQTQPGPARALGAVYFEVERGERHRLDAKFDADQIMLTPDEPTGAPGFKLNLNAANLQGNGSAVLFAVDEGILALTRHKEADPYGYFFGRRALDLGILNSYGRILQSEKSGAGHDGGDMLPRFDRLTYSNYTAERNLSLFYGPVPVVNGKASFDIYPADVEKFDGTLHLMGIVWSGDGVGAAAGTALVRSAVVAKLAMPRFIATGDTAVLPLTLNNVQGKPGKYEINLTASPPLKILGMKGPGTISDTGETRKILVSLNKGQRLTYDMTLTAPSSTVIDRTQIKVDLKGAEPSNVTETSTRLWDVNLRPPFAPSARLMSFKLAPGATQIVNAATLGLAADSYASDSLQAVAKIAPSPRPARAVAAGLSRDLPPISLEALSAAGTVLLGDEITPSTQGELKRLVNEMLALQTNSGGFLSYRSHAASDAAAGVDVDNGGGAALSITAVALEFLGKAAEAGVSVPADVQESGLAYLATELKKFLQNEVKDYQSENEPCDGGRILAALVLSQRGRIEDADVKAVYGRCAGPERTLPETAALAEMLHIFGEENSARLILAKFPAEIPEDQSLTKLAEAWAHLVAAKAPQETSDKLLNKLIGSGKAAPALPVEALAWISRGAATLMTQDTNARFDVALKDEFIGKRQASQITTRMLNKADIAKGIEIKNTGQVPAVVTLTLRVESAGSTARPEQGLTIRRRLFTAKGEELSGDTVTVKQNALLYAVIEGISLKDGPAVITDTLPTGFEIVRSDIFENTLLNKYLVENQMLDLTQQGTIDLTEARDDHWLAIVRPTKKDEKDQAAAYRTGYAVRASAAGTFALPPAVVEYFDAPEISASSLGTRHLTVQKAE